MSARRDQDLGDPPALAGSAPKAAAGEVPASATRTGPATAHMGFWRYPRQRGAKHAVRAGSDRGRVRPVRLPGRGPVRLRVHAMSRRANGEGTGPAEGRGPYRRRVVIPLARNGSRGIRPQGIDPRAVRHAMPGPSGAGAVRRAHAGPAVGAMCDVDQRGGCSVSRTTCGPWVVGRPTATSGPAPTESSPLRGRSARSLWPSRSVTA